MIKKETCLICSNETIDHIKLNCFHQFCRECTNKWCNEYKKKKCPICRQKISSQNFQIPITDLDHEFFINKTTKITEKDSSMDRIDLSKIPIFLISLFFMSFLIYCIKFFRRFFKNKP